MLLVLHFHVPPLHILHITLHIWSERGWSGYIGEQCNQGDLQTDPCKSSDYFIRIDGGCYYYLLCISTSHYNIPHAPSKINGLKTGTFYEELSEYVEKLSCASGKVIIRGDFNIFF